jgi:uncharacterized protein YqjF (DUF2071 family)
MGVMDEIAVPGSTSVVQVPAGTEHVFLAAEWRYLAMLNYEIDPAVLARYVPVGTELDRFDGKTFVSLVGFQFLSTKILGVPIPFHRDFDEVNLRFYVRRRVDGGVRRGVVFIQEIVPRRAIAAVARLAYNENYRCLPMAHRISFDEGALRVEYAWRLGSIWNRLTVQAAGAPRTMSDGSAEQFIAEHYWGYSAQPGGGCVEYHVAHPPWRVWDVTHAEFSGDAASLYGAAFADALHKPPDSAFLAEGSPVTVYRGKRIER